MTENKSKPSDASDNLGIMVEKPSKGLSQDKPEDVVTKECVKKSDDQVLQKELNGPKGLEPTRYGDWESKGRCYDF